jgi:hypothetical protein
MEAQVESGDRWRHFGADAEFLDIESVHSEHVPVRGVTGLCCSTA